MLAHWQHHLKLSLVRLMVKNSLVHPASKCKKYQVYFLAILLAHINYMMDLYFQQVLLMFDSAIKQLLC